ncbi:MAG: energy transducer TonB [Acidiferrobacterales bacterium]
MTETATIESYRAGLISDTGNNNSIPDKSDYPRSVDKKTVQPGSSQIKSSKTNEAGEFDNNDRAGLSFFVSILVHMIIILGVTFALPKLQEIDGLPSMEITLVQTHTDTAPDKADYLAQANQQGGGNTPKPETVKSPLPITEIGESEATIPVQQAMPRPQIKSAKEKTELLTTPKSSNKIWQSSTRPDKQDRQLLPANPGLLKSQQYLLERSRLNAQLSRQWNEYQQLPRRKYINARTKEFKYAGYMVAWQAKVERVGNINYPEEARRRGLSGDLVLDVVLAKDGSLDEVSIIRSSGYKLLDDAAIRIVALSAPFSAFPKKISQETDLLHITRTWKFNEQGWRGK